MTAAEHDDCLNLDAFRLLNAHRDRPGALPASRRTNEFLRGGPGATETGSTLRRVCADLQRDYPVWWAQQPLTEAARTQLGVPGRRYVDEPYLLQFGDSKLISKPGEPELSLWRDRLIVRPSSVFDRSADEAESFLTFIVFQQPLFSSVEKRVTAHFSVAQFADCLRCAGAHYSQSPAGSFRMASRGDLTLSMHPWRNRPVPGRPLVDLTVTGNPGDMTKRSFLRFRLPASGKQLARFPLRGGEAAILFGWLLQFANETP